MQEDVRPGSAKSAHELYVYLRSSVIAHGKRVYGCDRKCRLDMSYTLPSKVHHTGKSPSHLRAPPYECTVGQMRLLRFRWKLFGCVGNWISNGNWKFATESCSFIVYWYCLLLVTDFCRWVFSLAVAYFFLLLMVFFHCCQRKFIVVDKKLSLSTKSCCCQKKILVAFKWQLWATVQLSLLDSKDFKVSSAQFKDVSDHWSPDMSSLLTTCKVRIAADTYNGSLFGGVMVESYIKGPTPKSLVIRRWCPLSNQRLACQMILVDRVLNSILLLRSLHNMFSGRDQASGHRLVQRRPNEADVFVLYILTMLS